MKYHNYHTHTKFCDGSDEPETYVLSAINKNMTALGFSGHAPLPIDNLWSMKTSIMNDYFYAINELKVKYKKKIDIYFSLEIDYIPNITTDLSALKKLYYLDYTIGSVHLVYDKKSAELWFIDGPDKNFIEGLDKIFSGDIKKAVECYYMQTQEMILIQQPDIIGHLDKIKMNNKNRFFSVDEIWYKKLVADTLKVISKTSSIVEVNTRGIYKKRTDYLFPSTDILEQCYTLKIPVTINSDAHTPDELTNYFDETVQILKDIGYKGIQVLKEGKWVNQKM